MSTYLEKKNKLPTPLKDFLSSDIPRYETERVCFMYGLEEEKIQFLSAPIALIFVGDLKLKDYPSLIAKDLELPESILYGVSFEINQRIFLKFNDYFLESGDLLEEWSRKKTPPVISEDEAWKKVLEREPEILEREREKIEEERKIVREKEVAASILTSLPIAEALKKIPELGEQLITESHLELKSFPDPVRPSIKNWLSDYTYDEGYEPHNAMKRGIYLFQNENSKRLSSAEREKLAYLLKAYDEKTPVSININTKQMVFPQKAVIPERPKNISRINDVSKSPNLYYNNNGAKNYPANSIPVEREIPNIPQRTSPQTSNAGLNFSSPQKMPFESQTQSTQNQPVRKAPAPYQPYQPGPLLNLQEIQKKMEEKKALPKNLVNLKDDF